MAAVQRPEPEAARLHAERALERHRCEHRAHELGVDPGLTGGGAQQLRERRAGHRLGHQHGVAVMAAAVERDPGVEQPGLLERRLERPALVRRQLRREVADQPQRRAGPARPVGGPWRAWCRRRVSLTAQLAQACGDPLHRAVELVAAGRQLRLLAEQRLQAWPRELLGACAGVIAGAQQFAQRPHVGVGQRQLDEFLGPRVERLLDALAGGLELGLGPLVLRLGVLDGRLGLLERLAQRFGPIAGAAQLVVVVVRLLELGLAHRQRALDPLERRPVDVGEREAGADGRVAQIGG